ncbi:hypothetical protein ACIGZJ_36115 [Kitasatospora sp. NPDC052868]|uniref:hypothetical protein n=1 Tax=Kitasatospora sp. NPDC052868 TaxID=3364060 RepID=UPI0037C8AD96
MQYGWIAAAVTVVVAMTLQQLRVQRREHRVEEGTVHRDVSAVDPYAGAPAIGDELAELLQQQAAGRPFQGPQHREHLLRWAALCDRIALEEEHHQDPEHDSAGSPAIQAANALQAHDHVWDEAAGPLGPHAPEWAEAGGCRAYVRYQYAAWRAATRKATQ